MEIEGEGPSELREMLSGVRAAEADVAVLGNTDRTPAVSAVAA